MAKLKQPEQWATRIGVILAVAGSAVGLGNFLRFPGQAAQNGGGAFMLPYFISLLVLGIPLCWAEWTMGRYGGVRGFNSAPGIYSVIWRNKCSKYFGVLGLLIPLVIYMYYVVIEAWCLGYAFRYLIGDERLVGANSAEDFTNYFDFFVGKNENGVLLTTDGNRIFLWILLATFALNFFFIYRGVTKGIEVFCRFAMPTLVILALIVLVRVLTLGTPDADKPNQSVLGGLGFMWNPAGEKIWEAQTWLAASGQIFFSLSVGFGIIINYASYMRRRDDVVLSGLTASSMNEFFEVCLGGLITIPAAFIFLGMAAGDYGTFGLGFNALPNVFAQMPQEIMGIAFPSGRIFGFLWFFMLFIAAITSSLSMLQPVIAFLEEGFGLKRHASAALLGLLAALGALFVVYFSEGMVALDMMDFWVGTVFIFLLALFQSILYGWIFGIARGEREAHKGAHLRIPRFVQYMLKFVVPVYLGVIFVLFAWQTIPSKEAAVQIDGDQDFYITTELEQSMTPALLPPALRAELAAAKIKADDQWVFAVNQWGDRWEIRESRLTEEGERRVGALKYIVIRQEEGTQLFEYKPGYAENILSSQVAMLTMIFVGILIVFLLILIHIAGQRWEAEGRFDNLDDDDDPDVAEADK